MQVNADQAALRLLLTAIASLEVLRAAYVMPGMQAAPLTSAMWGRGSRSKALTWQPQVAVLDAPQVSVCVHLAVGAAVAAACRCTQQGWVGPKQVFACPHA